MSGSRVPPSEAPTIQPPPGGQSGHGHASTMPGGSMVTTPGEEVSQVTTRGSRPRESEYEPGAIIADSFRVERELGSGAMGVVLLATHLALDRRVALKVHRAGSPADVSRLAREAKALAKVQHPNVVGIYDVRESGGSLFIAMEYIEGESGRPWMTRANISWRARLEVCLQAARGLHAAHQAGLVHRDFKPENILIGVDGRVLVADFGLARTPGAIPIDPATPSPGVDAQLTAIGAVTGTPAYMSPEQWHGGAVDARSDVFALSVVIYEALYGRRPFAGNTAAELSTTITRGMVRAPPPDTGVPKAVFEVLRRGMAVSPGQRFGSVTMLVRALESAVSAPGRAGVALALGLAVVVFGGIGASAWALKASNDAEAEDSGVIMIEAGVASDEPEAEPEVTPPPLAIEPRNRKQSRPPAAVPPDPPADEPDKPEPVRGPSEAELQAATDHVEAVSQRFARGEASQAEVVAATQAEHALRRRSRDRPYKRAEWNGTSTFVCELGKRMEIRDVDAKLATGAAIEMEVGCGLKLVNVNIEAPIAIEGLLADRLEIEGGTFNVSHKGIELSGAEVEIADLRIEGDPLVAADFGMHSIVKISNSSFAGITALALAMHARAELDGGRMSGKTALDAGMSSTVQLRGTELDGKVKRGLKGRVSRL